MITQLLSGAQTGADRAALDCAIFRHIPHGGWCPKGRKAEDGKIPPQYQLTKTPSASYLQRTEWNVRDSPLAFPRRVLLYRRVLAHHSAPAAVMASRA